jgi:hypothetical protein
MSGNSCQAGQSLFSHVMYVVMLFITKVFGQTQVEQNMWGSKAWPVVSCCYAGPKVFGQTEVEQNMWSVVSYCYAVTKVFGQTQVEQI